jgi:DNA repair photolyase
MNFLYEPKGKAGKYAKLAVNISKHCRHSCTYCYNVQPGRKTAEDYFRDDPPPKPGLVDGLRADCELWTRKHMVLPVPFVHLCFVGDPFPLDCDHTVTRAVIATLHAFNFPVQVLTKGLLAPEDFVALHPKDKLGFTITTMDEIEAARWEPKAAHPQDRLAQLVEARERGLQTWLSHEPAVSQAGSVTVVRAVAGAGLKPDPFWIGPMNHLAREYDWATVKVVLKETVREVGLTDVVKFKDEVE